MTLDEIISRLECVQSKGKDSYKALCPAHKDTEPSLSISQVDGKVLLHCFAGCDIERIVSAIGITSSDLFLNGRGEKIPSVSDVTVKPNVGLTLESIAEHKRLPVGFIQTFGVTQTRRQGVPHILIPYTNIDGNIVAVRSRDRIGKGGFRWRKGDHPIPYGLERLPEIKRAGWVLLVEGESDRWTGCYYGISVLGIPGKSNWRPEWAGYLSGLTVYLWQEPDAEDLTERVYESITELWVIRAPESIKDLSEAHIQGIDVASLVTELRAKAFQPKLIVRAELSRRQVELRGKAAAVLQADDPLLLVEAEFRRLGYGGELRPAKVTYLSATTRLLSLRKGAILGHLLLVGPPSVGKSYTIEIVFSLLPEEAYHIIDAGSPRVLIYDETPLKHRVLLFGEADSLPAGEDNPAASAVRNLAQDGELHYDVVVRDSTTGDYVVRKVRKEGPTVLLTTSTRVMGGQLGSRFFTLEAPFDRLYIQAALLKQAELEDTGMPQPDSSLVAFQAYLQAIAPIDINVPFVRPLAEAISKSAEAPRILRDFMRIVSLVKAVTILRHARRETDSRGRFISTIDDYAYVYSLVADMYAASITGVTENIRAVVEAVNELTIEGTKPILKKNVQERTGYTKVQTHRFVDRAVKNGWLINQEIRRGYPSDLILGEPLPGEFGLPDPETLQPILQPQLEAAVSNVEEDNAVTSGYTVTPETDDINHLLHISDKPLPTETCGACGLLAWWQRPDGEWICGRCHPQP